MEMCSIYCNEVITYGLFFKNDNCLTVNPESVLFVLFLLLEEFSKWELKLR